MSKTFSRIIVGLAATTAWLGVAAPAMAYVGPGAGLTLLGALWGLIAAVVMTVGFIVLWPFRRYLFGRRRKGDLAAEEAESDDGQIGESTMLANRTERTER